MEVLKYCKAANLYQAGRSRTRSTRASRPAQQQPKLSELTQYKQQTAPSTADPTLFASSASKSLRKAYQSSAVSKYSSFSTAPPQNTKNKPSKRPLINQITQTSQPNILSSYQAPSGATAPPPVVIATGTSRNPPQSHHTFTRFPMLPAIVGRPLTCLGSGGGTAAHADPTTAANTANKSCILMCEMMQRKNNRKKISGLVQQILPRHA